MFGELVVFFLLLGLVCGIIDMFESPEKTPETPEYNKPVTRFESRSAQPWGMKEKSDENDPKTWATVR